MPNGQLISRLAALLLASAALAPLAPAAASVEQARSLIAEGNYASALTAARAAERADPNDYRAKYYVAMALYGLGQYAEADAAAKAALALAPEESKATITALIDRISRTQTSEGAYAEAEAAKAEGLFGKAARLYEEAWNADKTRYDAGIRAADLYGGTGEYLKAAKILREITASSAPAEIVQQARDALTRYASALKKIADGEYKQALAAAGPGYRITDVESVDAVNRYQEDVTADEWAIALSHFELAREAAGGASDPRELGRLQMAMAAGDMTAIVDWMKSARRYQSSFGYDRLIMLPRIVEFSRREDFLQLIADSMGSQVSEKLRAEFAPQNRFKSLQWLVKKRAVYVHQEWFNSKGFVARDYGYPAGPVSIESPCQITIDNQAMPLTVVINRSHYWVASDGRLTYMREPDGYPTGERLRWKPIILSLAAHDTFNKAETFKPLHPVFTRGQGFKDAVPLAFVLRSDKKSALHLIVSADRDKSDLGYDFQGSNVLRLFIDLREALKDCPVPKGKSRR